MAEHKKITAIYVVTDTEQATEQIGDIEGGLFPDEWLEKHIKSHGAGQLLECLAGMTSAVITAKYKVEREESERGHDCNACG
jgi:hypothetical protein